MNGPDHYREAERLAARAEEEYKDSQYGDPAPKWMLTLGLARLHADLARTAALVTTRAIGPVESWGGHSVETSGEWREATDE